MKHFITTIMSMICLTGFAQQKIYVCVSGEQIYTLNLHTCSSQLIGSSGIELFDIAVTSDGRLWGMASPPGYLYEIDTLTGAASFIGAMGFSGVALVELDDSTLLMAGGNTGTNLYKVDVTTGAATFIGVTGYAVAGDLTWYDNDLYMVAASGGILVKIQLNTSNTAIVSATAVNTLANPIPLCWGAITLDGAITSGFAFEINKIIGFQGQDAYEICPFDGSYQLLCSSIVPSTTGVINGAAFFRLPIQNPIPTACGPTGTNDEFLLSNRFEIFPNPVSNKFEIQSHQPEIRNVEIYSVTGEKIFQSDLSGMVSKISVDVSFLSRGIYFVTVTDINGNRVTRKLIKI